MRILCFQKPQVSKNVKSEELDIVKVWETSKSRNTSGQLFPWKKAFIGRGKKTWYMHHLLRTNQPSIKIRGPQDAKKENHCKLTRFGKAQQRISFTLLEKMSRQVGVMSTANQRHHQTATANATWISRDDLRDTSRLPFSFRAEICDNSGDFVNCKSRKELPIRRGCLEPRVKPQKWLSER